MQDSIAGLDPYRRRHLILSPERAPDPFVCREERYEKNQVLRNERCLDRSDPRQAFIAISRSIRSCVGGCVENRLRSPLIFPLNGFTMNMCAVAGLRSAA